MNQNEHFPCLQKDTQCGLCYLPISLPFGFSITFYSGFLSSSFLFLSFPTPNSLFQKGFLVYQLQTHYVVDDFACLILLPLPPRGGISGMCHHTCLIQRWGPNPGTFTFWENMLLTEIHLWPFLLSQNFKTRSLFLGRVTE